MALTKGTLFESQLGELINAVRGHSTIAKLSGKKPLKFNGSKEMIFTYDSDISIVAEGGAKVEGGVSIDPVTIVPIKFEYGARVSDEFMYASEEEQIEMMQSFVDGFGKKLAVGFDKAAFHGVNPKTGTASAVVGNNNFDAAVTQTVAYDATDLEGNIEDAITLVTGSNGVVNGMAISPVFANGLAKVTNGTNGPQKYPEFSWGGNPEVVNGMAVDVNSTVSEPSSDDRLILGDFANMFKWGIAKEIPLKVIEYGDPDNSGNDLQGHNQVYLRCEAYVGWGILDASSFARVEYEEPVEPTV